MRVKVMKFGGTSVATAEARMQAAMRVVSAKQEGFSPVVVVSAIGRRGEPYATDTLIHVLKDMDANVDPDPREQDLMIACGEILSSVVFAHLLKTLGHPAQSFRGGQAGIRTDGVYGNARITSIHPVSLFRSIERGYIPVVCGFQGVHVKGDGAPGGELTTLGRGGSDTTASALGASMNAECVEIFTDVEGVKTADPDYVPSAPTLRRVSYDEVAELAHLGAKVVHPRAAEIAMQYGIPLWVKSTFSDDPGTEIISRDATPGSRLTGVAHTGKLVHFEFDLSSLGREERRELQSHLYDLLAQNSASLYMLNLGPTGTGFAVPRDQFPLVERLLDGLVVPTGGKERAFVLLQVGVVASRAVETQEALLKTAGLVDRVVGTLTEGCTMVSVIGQEALQQPGMIVRVLQTLDQEKVPVLQTSDSDFSISCLIPESESRRAVRVLHDQLGLQTST